MRHPFSSLKLLSRCAATGLLCLCFLRGPGLAPLCAQTNSPPSGPSANRFLVVMETSRSMRRFADGALNAVAACLNSQMQGQLRPGDTLGVWTFNTQLNTGLFPLQWWPARGREAVADSVLEFLHGQKFEKRANLDKVIPEVSNLVQDSDFITVLLVTSGEGNIHGTPFDDHINGTFKAAREQQQKARMPFVTVLRGRKGMLTDYTVNSAQWPVELPPLPPEAQVAKVAEKDKKPATKPAPPMAPPLIVHGKKPDTARLEPPVPVPQAVSTNAAPLVIGKLSPPAMQSAPAMPAPATQPTAELSKATAPPPQSARPAEFQSSNAPPILLAAAAPVASNPKPALLPQPEPVVAPAAAPVAPSNVPPPATPAVPAPAPVVGRAPVPDSASSIQAAVVPPAKAIRIHDPLWTAAAVLLGAGLGAAFLWLRRPRYAPRASLISRSLERGIK